MQGEAAQKRIYSKVVFNLFLPGPHFCTFWVKLWNHKICVKNTTCLYIIRSGERMVFDLCWTFTQTLSPLEPLSMSKPNYHLDVMEGCRKNSKSCLLAYCGTWEGKVKKNETTISKDLKRPDFGKFFCALPLKLRSIKQKTSSYYIFVIIKYFPATTHSVYSSACLQNFQLWRKYLVTLRIRFLSIHS